jgi:hypothetical protein
MLLESIRLDWFHNVRRLVGNSRRGSAPSELSCDLCKITGGHQSYNACLGWTSRQNGMRAVCVTPVTVYHQTPPLSPPVLYSGLPVRMVMSSQCTLYHASAELSCTVPAKAGRKSWPAVRPTRCVVVSKDLSTDVSRPGPACHCPCTHGGSLSLDTLARPFSLTRKRRMRLLPPRLGPYSVPHAGACLQMSEVATATQLQWSHSLPFRS